MQFHITKQSVGVKHKKDGRINIHRFWTFFTIGFIMLVTIAIVCLTYYFVITSRTLDEPVAPRLDTNAGTIKKIEQSIIKTEEAVYSRTGQGPSSQNDAPIVQ
jgi:hypothetical protein